MYSKAKTLAAFSRLVFVALDAIAQDGSTAEVETAVVCLDDFISSEDEGGSTLRRKIFNRPQNKEYE